MNGAAQRKTRTRGVSPERIAAVMKAVAQETGERVVVRLLPGGRAELLTGGDVVPLVAGGESATDLYAPRRPDAP